MCKQNYTTRIVYFENKKLIYNNKAGKDISILLSVTERRKRECWMYFHYSPVYSQFILYLYLIYVSIVIIYAE